MPDNERMAKNIKVGGKDELRRRRLTQSYRKAAEIVKKRQSVFDLNHTYIVEAVSQEYNDENSLFYCGLVRQFYDDCSSA